MDRSTALHRLRALEAPLRDRGVDALFLYGSTARGASRNDSDLDLFFDYRPERRLSILDLIGIRHFLQDTLAARVDVTTRSSLHPLLRADIEAEAISVF